MLRIAITDDNEALRQNISDRLRKDFQIVYEASSAKSLLRWLKSNEAQDHPQIILMDIEMDDMNGIEATRLAKEVNPSIRIIMLTVFEDEEKILNAIKAGADGYLIKDEKRDRIIECIHDVHDGGSYLSPTVASKAMKYLQKSYIPENAAPGNPLSKREQEILELVIDGNTYHEIAARLFISMGTVKSHIYHIYEKLQVKNKIEAAKKASGNKWI
ncbi:MAG TPA: response regulator transcription factor [Puia sp.]|nr:response regulator transcription factor [Puia sp.]